MALHVICKYKITREQSTSARSEKMLTRFCLCVKGPIAIKNRPFRFAFSHLSSQLFSIRASKTQRWPHYNDVTTFEKHQLVRVNIGCYLRYSGTWALNSGSFSGHLKLYCRYLYTCTRPYMINRIWSLKQLWLQVNGHAWFHLHGLHWPVRNGEGAKNSKWKYMFPAGFEPTPRQSMTGKSAPETARPRWLDIKWSVIV